MNTSLLFPTFTGDACAYCLEELMTPDGLIDVLDCGHKFHHFCVEEHRDRTAKPGPRHRWSERRLRAEFKCPLCRAKGPAGEVIRCLVLSDNEEKPEELEWFFGGQPQDHLSGSEIGIPTPPEESTESDVVPVPTRTPKVLKRTRMQQEREAARVEGRPMSHEARVWFERKAACERASYERKKRRREEVSPVLVEPQTLEIEIPVFEAEVVTIAAEVRIENRDTPQEVLMMNYTEKRVKNIAGFQWYF